MRTKVLIYVVLALFLSLPLDIAAQYCKDYKKCIDMIEEHIGECPDSGSTEDQLDRDYYSIAYGIRFIAHIDDKQAEIFGIEEDLREMCKQRDSIAWSDDIEYNVHAMLHFFEEELGGDLTKLDTKRVGIFCKFIGDVLEVNELLKKRFDRWRPWYHFWGKVKDDKLTNEKEVKEYIQRDYERSQWNAYSLSSVNKSYPSGHSVIAYASAIMMANLFYNPNPRITQQDFADTLLKKAHRFAMSRVVLGVHHYSDIKASYKQAIENLILLKTTDQFRNDLDSIGLKYTDLIYKIDYPFSDIDDLFLKVAKLGRLKFTCIEHGVTFTMEVNDSTKASKESRYFVGEYRCDKKEDCRIHCSWIYGKKN